MRKYLFLILYIKCFYLIGQSNIQLSFDYINITKYDTVFVEILNNDKTVLNTIDKKVLLASGDYKISFSTPFEKQEENITLNKDTTLYIVFNEAKYLEAVQIYAKKNALEFSSDKTTINIDPDDPFFKGANFFEAIALAPEVMVVDRNIDVLGSNRLLYLIKGKEVNSLIIKNLKAFQIQSIEVYSNPPAQYQANYDAVINIILKKGALSGYDIDFYETTTINKTNSFNPGTTIRYNDKKWTVFMDFNFEKFKDYNISEYNNEFPSYQEANNQEYRRNDNTYYFNSIVDYELNENHNLGVQMHVDFGQGIGERKDRSELINSSLQFVNSKSMYPGKDNNFSTNIYHQYAKNKIKIDTYSIYGFSKSENNNTLESVDDQHNIILSQEQERKEKGEVFILNSDATYNFKNERDKLLFGTRYSYLNGDYNNTIVTFNEKQDNYFTFEESILSTYLNYYTKLKSIDLSLGTRVEAFDRLIAFSNLDTNYRAVNVFPSMSLSKKFNSHTYIFSFSSKIARNNYQEILPYEYSSNFNNQFKGNPYLRNMLSYNFQLKYNYRSKLFIIPYHIYNKDKTSQYNLIEEDIDVLTIQYGNYNETRTGVFLALRNIKLLNSLSINTTLSGQFVRTIDNSDFIGFNNQIYDWKSTTNIIYKSKIGNFILLYNYVSPTYWGNYKINEPGFFNLSYNHDFFDGSLALRLSFNDVFKTRRQDIVTTTNNYRSSSTHDRNWRGISLFVTYNIQYGRNKHIDVNIENEEINRF